MEKQNFQKILVWRPVDRRLRDRLRKRWIGGVEEYRDKKMEKTMQ